MDKGKGVIRRNERHTNQQSTFSRSQEVLFSQANDLAARWDAEVGIIVFSNNGDMSIYCNESSSLDTIVDRYKSRTGSGALHPQQHSEPQLGSSIHGDLVELREGINHIAQNLLHYTSVDNWRHINLNDMDMLERHLRSAITEVQVKKDQLLHHELQTLQKREQMLAEANQRMYDQIQMYEAGEQQKQQDHQQDLLQSMMMATSSSSRQQHEVVQNDVLNQFPFAGEEQPNIVLHLATLQPLFDPHHLHQQQQQQTHNFQIKNEDQQQPSCFGTQSLNFQSPFDPPRL